MDLHNLNDMLAAIEDLGVETSAGTFVRMEDVRRLALERKIAETEAHPDEPQPKTWLEARSAAKEWLAEENPPPQPQLGRAVPAFVSPSAVEGV
jgi:hypothetical protein